MPGEEDNPFGDFCEDDLKTIVEGYCDAQGYMRTATDLCLQGCVDGACLKLEREVDCDYAIENDFSKFGHSECEDNNVISDYWKDNMFARDCVEKCSSTEVCIKGVTNCVREEKEKFFPIGIYYAVDSPSSEEFRSIADLDANIIVVGGNTIEDKKELLQTAENYGLNVILTNLASNYFAYADDYSENTFLTILNDFGSFPSLFRFYLMDEPDANPDIKPFASASYRILEDINQKHFWISTFTYEGVKTRFIDEVKPNELLMDSYPLADWANDYDSLQIQLSNYASIVEAAKKTAVRNDIPFWIAVQSFSDSGWREPTPNELRELVWLPLTYGAQGIFYFRYNYIGGQGNGLIDINDNPTSLYYEVQKINAQLNALSPILLNLKWIGSANSKMIGVDSGENLVNEPADKWTFDDWEEESSISKNKNELLIDLKRKNTRDEWFNFELEKNINSTEYPYLQIDYEVLPDKNSDYTDFSFDFEIERESGVSKPHGYFAIDSSLGQHTKIINLENFKGGSLKRDVPIGDSRYGAFDSDIITKLKFYMFNPLDKELNAKIKITSIKKASINLPNVRNISGNFEAGTFEDKENKNYIILVNRDTENFQTTKIEMDSDYEKLIDVYSKKEISLGNSAFISFEAGEGKLFELKKSDKSKSFFAKIADKISGFFRRG